MSDLVHRPPGTLARPEARPGFFSGVGALFSGAGFVIGTPSIWPLAMVPVVIALLVTGLSTGVTWWLVLPPLGAWLRAHLGTHLGFLATIAEIVVGAFVLATALLLGFAVAQPLSGSALNRIVQRSEATLGPRAWPQASFVEDVGAALQSIAVAYAIGLPLLAILWIVTLVFPPASVVTFPLKMVVLAMMMAWDLCDYPLSIHRMPVRARVAFVTRNFRAMLGFGLGLGLLSLVPFAVVLALPFGVAGAARLTRRIELFEEGERR